MFKEHSTETWSLILCQNPKSGPEVSSQGVCESTEKQTTAGSRIMSQEIQSPKFSIKSLLNRGILCPHKTGCIDALNQNLLLTNLANDFMAYDTYL